jgi:predicted NAD/FAD-binding protein
MARAASFPLLAAVLIVALPFPVLSQDPPRQAQLAVAPSSSSLCVDDPAEHEVEDVRARVAGMRLQDGVIQIGRTPSGLRLVAVAQGGRVVDYAVVDAEGRSATTLSTLAVGPAGDDCNPCCWKCGKDGGGTVHCWQIECPVIVSNTGGRD